MRYLVTMSRDAVEIHAETILEADTEPGFWELYDLAEENGCDWFTCEPITE